MTLLQLKKNASSWALANAYNFLRISIGIIYVWFGALKFFPGLSPAEDLATCTIHEITFGFLPDHVACLLLASWEVLLGVFLIFNLFRKFSIYALVIHMICTFSPLFLFPELSFTQSPYGLTLVGQYIMKNLVIVSAALVLISHRQKRTSSDKLVVDQL